MKIEIIKKVFILLLGIFNLIVTANAQFVNIPDPNFKGYLLSNTAINTDSDEEISVEEAATYTGQINVGSLSISDLTGIEAFVSITKLYCGWNPLFTLDVSNNSNLTVLWCQGDSLTHLDVSANINLTEFICHSNFLISLDVSKNTNLATLDCYFNQLTNLDVSNNTNLTILHCGRNLLTDLDISANTKLYDFNSHFNLLTSLDVSSNTDLTILFCGANSLSDVDISKNLNLTHFDCSSNQFKSLNISLHKELVVLGCNGNKLTSLDVSANSNLRDLNCAYNFITNLDLSANTNLTDLHCYGDSLISLNIKNGNNINLTTFNVTDNPNLSCILVDSAEYMAVNWSAGIDITASFNDSICPFTIFANALPINSGTIYGAGNYYPDDTVILTATANPGFTFTNWTENGVEVSTNPSYSFLANNNRILSANFASSTIIPDFDQSKALTIYPNPNTGQMILNIDNNYFGELNIRIYSATGVLIKELKVDKSTNKIVYHIDLDDINVGVYFINITSTKEKITEKILMKE